MQVGELDRMPLYQQLRNRIMGRIQAGEWRGGQFLPPEPELAREYNVSQGTVRKALDLLEFQRVLVRKRGCGTSVCGQIEYSTLSESATKTLATIGATFSGAKIKLGTGELADANGLRALADGVLDVAAWVEKRTPTRGSRNREAA